jgi:predicted nucleic acid-binding Zn ribbon protein
MAFRRRPRRTIRERALAQLRGYWEPQDVSKYTRDSETVVEDTLKELGLESRFNEEQVFDAWNSMVSNFIAQNARPVSLQRGVLNIQVLHSTVHYELERMKSQLLAKMQDSFGRNNVKEIRFRLG